MLQVTATAHPKVIAAAAAVLRELALTDEGPGAPARLVEIDRARNLLRERGRLAEG